MRGFGFRYTVAKHAHELIGSKFTPIGFIDSAAKTHIDVDSIRREVSRTFDLVVVRIAVVEEILSP